VLNFEVVSDRFNVNLIGDIVFCYGIIFLSLLAQQPLVGQTFPSIEVSLSHSDTPHSVGLLRTSDQLVAEAATYTTHNKHKRRTSMLSAGFDPAIPAIKPPQSWDRLIVLIVDCVITAV
jgi:hypothetical protein